MDATLIDSAIAAHMKHGIAKHGAITDLGDAVTRLDHVGKRLFAQAANDHENATNASTGRRLAQMAGVCRAALLDLAWDDPLEIQRTSEPKRPKAPDA